MYGYFFYFKCFVFVIVYIDYNVILIVKSCYEKKKVCVVI